MSFRGRMRVRPEWGFMSAGAAHVKNQKWRPVKIGLGALAPWRPGDGSTLGGHQSWEKSKVEASENRPWRLGPLAAR